MTDDEPDWRRHLDSLIETVLARDGPAEADFVVSHGTRYFAVEVKSGRHSRLSGLESFRRRYPKAVTILIGSDGIPLPEFFSREPTVWFR